MKNWVKFGNLHEQQILPIYIQCTVVEQSEKNVEKYAELLAGL
jgi:hypothetical protein